MHPQRHKDAEGNKLHLSQYQFQKTVLHNGAWLYKFEKNKRAQEGWTR